LLTVLKTYRSSDYLTGKLLVTDYEPLFTLECDILEIKPFKALVWVWTQTALRFVCAAQFKYYFFVQFKSIYLESGMGVFSYLALVSLIVFLVGCSTTPQNVSVRGNIVNLSDTYTEPTQSKKWAYVLKEIQNNNIVNILDSLKEHSALGNYEAQYYLGVVYEQGIGGVVDKAKSIELYASSADNGYPPAQYRLVLLYTGEKDYSAAFKWCKKASENQFYESYGLLGYLYENGYGVEADAEKSVQYYQTGTYHGDPNAMFQLAEIHYHGKFGSIDHDKAFNLYLDSAKGGVLNAQDMLGNMYEFGYGTDKNIELASHWYKLSASRGHQRSQNSLGALYALGIGVPKSQSDAIYWYGLSAEQGYSEAQFNLGSRFEKGFGVDQDYVAARRWYEKAASQGHEKAIYNLAILHMGGNGGSVDYVEALNLFKKTIDVDEAWLAIKSEYMIGHIYEKGLGVDENIKTAVLWYRRAAFHGSIDAKARLTNIEDERRRSSKNAVFYYNDALKELESRNHSKAENLLRAAIEFKSDFIEAYFTLGATLGMQARYEESIELLNEAISMFPWNANLHANIGFSYSKIFDWNSAIEHYKKALIIDPGHERTRYNLKKALEHVGK